MRCFIISGFNGYGKLFCDQLKKVLSLEMDHMENLFYLDADDPEALKKQFCKIRKQAKQLLQEDFGFEQNPDRLEWIVSLDNLHSQSSMNVMELIKSEAENEPVLFAAGLSYPGMVAAFKELNDVDTLEELKESIKAQTVSNLQIFIP
ncbi:hypothetical protein [Ileibacterium valens]|uniref:Uncharacterized protein n=1 Tax=Ileibacterium valens TaxID=1862668 RepID=A0A1U7NJ08_9FIRM|nr:hypothetical protein [Ileibacterium valens]OLU42685.1 hypothetical protein BM735_01805 [Erysipelotrichaceae bacterium NYU-BL-F16]OLU42717.1 hypothetical protein BO224_01505 [Erysipelotrichaceae bacterium NYU-BL-E8]OLU42847.1 hypothetical protein BO222_00970 [Ileibacterium valens]